MFNAATGVDCGWGERQMKTIVLTRLLQAVPALLGVTAVAFALLYLTGDPSQTMLPPEATETTRAASPASCLADSGKNEPATVYGTMAHEAPRD